MGIESYKHDLPWVMKLVNNYTKEISKNRNFRKTLGKDQAGVAFTHNHNKDNNERKINSKVELHCFHCGKQDHLVV